MNRFLFSVLWVIYLFTSSVIASAQTDFIAGSDQSISDFSHLPENMPDSSKLNYFQDLGDSLLDAGRLSAIQYLKSALNLSVVTGNNRKRAEILSKLGTGYEIIGDYVKTLSCYFQALKLAEQLNDLPMQAKVLNNMSGTYTLLGQYEHSEELLLQSLRIFERLKDLRSLTTIYGNLGGLNDHQGNLSKAIMYTLKTIRLAESHPGWKLNMSIPYINIGVMYSEQAQYDKAIRFLNMGLANAGTWIDTVTFYTAMAGVFIYKKEYSKALKYYRKAEPIYESYKSLDNLARLYTDIAFCLRKTGHFKEALDYKENQIQVASQIFNEKVSKQFNEMQVKYETEKMDARIKLLNIEKDSMETKIRQEHYIRNLIVFLSISLLIVLVLVSRNLVLRQQVKNRLLREEKDEIERLRGQAERDKEKLQHENTEAKYEVLRSKTSPHFLFNTINILSSIVQKDPELASQYLDKFADLYRKILSTGSHNLISLREELEIVRNYMSLQRMRFRDNLKSDIVVHVNPDLVQVPPFVVQLCIENALKHNVISRLHPLEINIECGGEEIVIRNTLQKRSMSAPSTSTGQRNIAERYALISSRKPTFEIVGEEYLVTLPLIKLIRKNEDDAVNH